MSMQDSPVGKKKALQQRDKSVKILCVGVTGSGKSTLVNGMIGDTVARTGFGPRSVQSEIKVHNGVHDDISVDIYDTIGFSDANISDKQIVKELTNCQPKEGFDLILLCLRMDVRADAKVKQMLQSLLKVNWLNSEMLKRMVVVLTFANSFLRLDEIEDLEPEEKREAILQTIEEFFQSIREPISEIAKRETIETIDIPFCLAGSMKKRQLPTTEDWLVTLWETCILHCREETKPLFEQLEKKRFKELKISSTMLASGAAGAVLGAGVGALVGTLVFPVVGTGIGAGIGAAIGGGGAAAVSGSAITLTRHFSQHQSKESDECDLGTGYIVSTR